MAGVHNGVSRIYNGPGVTPGRSSTTVSGGFSLRMRIGTAMNFELRSENDRNDDT